MEKKVNEIEQNEVMEVEQKGEIVKSNVENLFSNITKNVYCSKNTETVEDKKSLFNALENCDVLLNDCVGQEIEIKDIYIEEREVFDTDTGIVKTKYRTIIFDKNGQTYATGSYGIYNVLKKIVQIYGLPTTWNESMKVKVTKRPIGNGKSTLTLTLI